MKSLEEQLKELDVYPTELNSSPWELEENEGVDKWIIYHAIEYIAENYPHIYNDNKEGKAILHDMNDELENIPMFLGRLAYMEVDANDEEYFDRVAYRIDEFYTPMLQEAEEINYLNEIAREEL